MDEYTLNKNSNVLESYDDRRARHLLNPTNIKINNRYQTGVME